jgi:undecaprenyl-diphosphatase
MPGWLAGLSALVAANPGWLSAALFATALAESLAIAGLLVPGVAILFALTALAGQTGMALGEALFWVFFGAIVGDTLSFALGRLLTGKLNSVWPMSRYPAIVTRGEAFFYRHGAFSIVAGRFIGPIRPIIPLVAGALWMPWHRFVVFNISSAVAWAPVYVLPGFVVGSALTSELRPPPHVYAVSLVSVGVLLLVYLVLFRAHLGLTGRGRVYQYLEQVMQNYRASHRFWHLYSKQRPTNQGEFPLASLMLGLGSASLFALWSQLAVFTDVLRPFDQAVLEWFTAWRQPLLDIPAVAITSLSDPAILLMATALAGLALTFRGFYAGALHCLAAGVLTAVLVWALKNGFAAARPEIVFAPPQSASFPSGHTAGITVLVTLAASFIAAEAGARKRWQIYTLASLPLLPVALSRLYLGVHWFSDIVGGLLLGLAVTGLVRASYSRYDRIALYPDSTTAVAFTAWLVFCGGYLYLRWPQALADYAPAIS